MFADRVATGTSLLLIAAVGACTTSPDEPNADESKPKVTPTAPSPSAVDRIQLDEVEDRRVELSSPDWLASGFGSLWVKRDDGAVVRVSPKGRILATIDADIYQPPVCQGLGVTADAVWACATEGTIIRIDPTSNKIAATIDVPKINEQGRLVSAGGHVWLLTGDGDRVTGISEQTNKVGDPIELGTFCTETADRIEGSTLWVVCASEGVLLRVDLESRRVTGKVGDLPLATNVTVGDGVWVGFEKGLARVDPDSLEVSWLQESVSPIRVHAVGDHVWVREEGGEAFLTRIDATTGQVGQVIASDDLTSGGDVMEIDGGVWASAYDDGTVVRLKP